MKITTEQRQKWLYHLNKHKDKIEDIIKKQFEMMKKDEAFAQEAFKHVGDNHIDVVCFKSLLNFYTDIMQQLWNNFERLVEVHKEKKEEDNEPGI